MVGELPPERSNWRRWIVAEKISVVVAIGSRQRHFRCLILRVLHDRKLRLECLQFHLLALHLHLFALHSQLRAIGKTACEATSEAKTLRMRLRASQGDGGDDDADEEGIGNGSPQLTTDFYSQKGPPPSAQTAWAARQSAKRCRLTGNGPLIKTDALRVSIEFEAIAQRGGRDKRASETRQRGFKIGRNIKGRVRRVRL